MGMVFCLFTSVTESEKIRDFYRWLSDLSSFFPFSICRIPLHNARPLDLGLIGCIR
jgi:hypothetical protein